MNRIVFRVIAVGIASFFVIQTSGAISSVKAAVAPPILVDAYVDQSSSPGCNGKSPALIPDENGDCAITSFELAHDRMVSDGTGVMHIAAGDYHMPRQFDIGKPMVVVGAGKGVTNIINDSTDYYAMRVLSYNTTLKDFTLTQNYYWPAIYVFPAIINTTITNTEISGGAGGIYLGPTSNQATVSNNVIHDTTYGIEIAGSSNNNILDNHIYSSTFDIGLTAGVYYSEPDYDLNLNIDGNLIQGNLLEDSSEGITFGTTGDNTLIIANTIQNMTGAQSGIHVGAEQTNLRIKYNKLISNDCALSVYISTPPVERLSFSPLSDPNAIDATLNWWGTADYAGYDTSEYCSNNLIFSNSTEVVYQPFLLKESYATLDTITEVVSDINTFGNSGLIEPEGDPSATPSATFIHSAVFEIPANGGTSQITVPENTVITKTDGGLFDSEAFSSSEIAGSTLSGLASGTVVEGAFQWGIPQVGLSFDPAITMKIFVGTDLDGKTLNIQRSVTGNGDWTDDGIVDPKTCTVTDGYCTFQATKASYYVASTTGLVIPVGSVLPVTGRMATALRSYFPF